MSEDYVVYRFTRVEDAGGQALPASVLRELDVAPLLLNEDRPISEQGEPRAQRLAFDVRHDVVDHAAFLARFDQ